MDRDSSNWLFILAILGITLIFLFSIFDTTPFIVRTIGNLCVLGSLLFLFDVQGGTSFKRTYWGVLVIWGSVLIHSLIAFIIRGETALQVFGTVTILMYALTLLSVPMFMRTMRLLSSICGQVELARYWKVRTRFSATYYAVPIVVYLATVAGRALGADVQLFYGAANATDLPGSIVKYGVRALFFLPTLFVIAGLRKTTQVNFEVAP